MVTIAYPLKLFSSVVEVIHFVRTPSLNSARIKYTQGNQTGGWAGPQTETLSASEPELRVIITQILHLLLRQQQTIISLPTIALLILRHHSEIQHRAHQPTHPKQSKRGAIPGMELRYLRREIDIRPDDPTNIAQTNLHRRPEGTLIMSTHVVCKPDNRHGLRDIHSDEDEETGEIADSDRHCTGAFRGTLEE